MSPGGDDGGLDLGGSVGSYPRGTDWIFISFVFILDFAHHSSGVSGWFVLRTLNQRERLIASSWSLWGLWIFSFFLNVVVFLHHRLFTSPYLVRGTASAKPASFPSTISFLFSFVNDGSRYASKMDGMDCGVCIYCMLTCSVRVV